IDACFISPTWHITTSAMFAGSYIGVILLVMALEFLRSTAKDHDCHILRQFQHSLDISPPHLPPSSTNIKSCPEPSVKAVGGDGRIDAARATLHMQQFGEAYFVTLLAIYVNGHIIECIIIGVWMTVFTFN
ncbi:Tctr2 protein, partial [Amylocarpus encephaloides]